MLTDLKAMATLATLSVLACTRPNPAFVDEAGGSSDTISDATDTKPTSDEGAEGPVDASGSDTGDSNASDPTSASESGPLDMGPEPCSVADNQRLHFKLFSDAGLEPCGESLSAYFAVEGPSFNNQILAQPCSEGCEVCNDGPGVELEAWPADISGLATSLQGACVHVEFANLVSASDNYCEWDKAMFWRVLDFQEEAPVLVGSSWDGEIPLEAEDLLAELGLLWEFVGFPCECPDGDPCCLPDDPPTAYDYEFDDGTVLRPGDSHLFQIDGSSAGWTFEAWDSEYINSCGAEFEASWVTYVGG